MVQFLLDLGNWTKNGWEKVDDLGKPHFGKSSDNSCDIWTWYIYIIGLYCMTVYSMYHNNIQVRMNMGKPQTKPMVYHYSQMFFFLIYIYICQYDSPPFGQNHIWTNRVPCLVLGLWRGEESTCLFCRLLKIYNYGPSYTSYEYWANPIYGMYNPIFITSEHLIFKKQHFSVNGWWMDDEQAKCPWVLDEGKKMGNHPKMASMRI